LNSAALCNQQIKGEQFPCFLHGFPSNVTNCKISFFTRYLCLACGPFPYFRTLKMGEGWEGVDLAIIIPEFK